MIVKFIVFLKLLLIVNCQHSKNDVNDDSYWRDFEGTVPNDAIPGGSTESNKTTYIGQAVYYNNLILGEIYNNKLYVSKYSQLISITENIKILCTTHPRRFEWRQVNDIIDFRRLTKENMIFIEMNKYEKFYLGRAHFRNHAVVGVIRLNDDGTPEFQGSSEMFAFNTKTFQVLYYNPLLKSTSIRKLYCIHLLLISTILTLYRNVIK
ncbi:hypothetical protein FQA39_LY08210 [Lamprigera yunnana]|nr:hypothetical protein FQA39_LY08210 [Lamprigera yunnana]